tara:strand:- start:816 stop:1247 length:432 start_codon:yes stop_codon:yes gene_type:complete
MNKIVKKILENNDTLITYGEEALTMRKDDPRTKVFKDKMVKEMDDNRKMYEEVQKNPFVGVNLSNARDEDETYLDYKTRLKLNKILLKQYRKMGKVLFLETYPAGVKYAIEQAKDDIKKNIKPKMTATIDGKEIPVIINNDKK